MSRVVLILLALFGVACVVVGVALYSPPASLILFGCTCVAVALTVEVRR